jgi:hypothetical protein
VGEWAGAHAGNISNIIERFIVATSPGSQNGLSFDPKLGNSDLRMLR